MNDSGPTTFICFSLKEGRILNVMHEFFVHLPSFILDNASCKRKSYYQCFLNMLFRNSWPINLIGNSKDITRLFFYLLLSTYGKINKEFFFCYCITTYTRHFSQEIKGCLMLLCSLCMFFMIGLYVQHEFS